MKSGQRRQPASAPTARDRRGRALTCGGRTMVLRIRAVMCGAAGIDARRWINKMSQQETYRGLEWEFT